MLSYVAAYVGTAIVYLVADLAWLGTVGKSFYKQKLGALLTDKPGLVPTIAFYLLFVLGIVIFAVMPGLRDGGWKVSLEYGALFGFFAYALYDLTNLATIRGWAASVSLVDLVWGTVLTAIAAAAGTWAVGLVS